MLAVARNTAAYTPILIPFAFLFAAQNGKRLPQVPVLIIR